MAKMRMRQPQDKGNVKKNLGRSVRFHKFAYKASVILNVLQALTTLYIIFGR